jgi:hypothetical protein
MMLSDSLPTEAPSRSPLHRTRSVGKPRVIMETLGHSQISLTLSTYSHVLPALQVEAAAKIDAVLG